MALSRSNIVLKYIVEYFIKTAQPVGSQTLIDEYKLSYSSATIRNEMHALEKMGYIEKTHSSSGRVPSTKGYRYYCENLRDGTVNEQLKNSIQSVLDQKIKSIEEVIKESCEILSHMTNLVTVVMGPDEREEKLASIQMIQISNNSITAIFVTDKGYVENKTFIVPENISAKEVVSCVSLLNDRLKGTPIVDLVEKTEALKPILSEYIVGHDLVYQALLETFVRFASDRLSLYGRDELFTHEEYKNDVEKLEKIFKLLSNQSLLKEVKREIREDERGRVLRIGDLRDNPDVSMVSARINLGQDGESAIALLGPTRIDYDQALSALDYIAKTLTDYFNDINKGGQGDA
ncbi:MAG TPA: heat-inducible transcription repressor HrcA [Erysipelotrichaceae bacterium]|nr:heat-inducible transcription repressor HrcA [Erysipelotrichaceae bacterium]